MQARWSVLVLFGCGSSTVKAPMEPPPVTPGSGSAITAEAPAEPPAEPPAPPKAPYNVDTEIAWAKQRFPTELGTYDQKSHLSELLGWVAQGMEMHVWVKADQLRCKPAILGRNDGGGDLSLMVYTDERTVGRERIRKFDAARAGDELFLGAMLGSEKQQKDGTWVEVDRGRVSDVRSAGHLSEVTKDYARWGGRKIRVSATCKGAITKAQCSNAKQFDCNACTDVALTIVEHWAPPQVVGSSSPPAGCTCPATSPNPDLERMQKLSDRLSGWTSTMTAPPTIYRLQEDCLKAK